MRGLLCGLGALLVSGCGSADGELTIEVASDGTVRIQLVSADGEPVRGSDLYVRVRGVRTQLVYAASLPVDTLCEQLPTSGPLTLRLSVPLSACPEIHAAAYRHEPPEPVEGEDPAPVVPVSERCTTHQSLLSTLVWSDGACGTSPTDGGMRDVVTATAAVDAAGLDAAHPDASESADAGSAADSG